MVDGNPSGSSVVPQSSGIAEEFGRPLKVYVSGRINGMLDGNEYAFRMAGVRITQMGHIPLLPQEIGAWEHPGECPRGYSQEGGHSSCCWLRNDLITMLSNCHAIYMLRDWQNSIGARLEHEVATLCGLQVYYQEPTEDLPPVLRKEF